MKDEHSPLDDANDTSRATDAPGDVAGLYSWANLEDTGYRDFSAARDQARATRRPRKPNVSGLPPTLRPGQTTPAHSAAATSTGVSTGTGPRRLTAVRKPSQATTRWAALDRIFAPSGHANEQVGPESSLPVPTLALLSLAGGVGKTILATSLSRSLAAQGRRVLLVDTRPYGLLPLLFAAPAITAGAITTVSCGAAAAPLAVLSYGTHQQSPKTSPEVSHAEQLRQGANGMQQVVIDMASGSAAMMHQLVPLASHILTVLTPDMASLSSLQTLQSLLEPLLDTCDERPIVHYLLNQFDPTVRLHTAILNVLKAQLGEQLLPFVVHQSSSLQEAMAEGLPVEQYAPDTEVVQDLHHLAQWVSSLDETQSGALLARRWKDR